MLERFKGGIEINQNKDRKLEEKNKKRHEAIEEKFSDIQIDKNKFVDYVQRKDLHNGKKDTLEKVKDIDFSKANPRNNSFMNELAFAGQSIAEGFLDVFNIEQNKAIEKYKDQLQVIEQRNDKGDSRYFIGTFNNNKLKRLTKYSENKEDLQERLEKQKELSKTKELEKKQEPVLRREKIKED